MINLDKKLYKLDFNEIDSLLQKQFPGQCIKHIDTHLEQEENRWKRGRKHQFQQDLVYLGLKYFAYIKFYIGSDGKKYGIVAGKSGSKSVNPWGGCDLSFSEHPKPGKGRKWLDDNNKNWCHTEIYIIKALAQDMKTNEKESFDIERYIQTNLHLAGS